MRFFATLIGGLVGVIPGLLVIVLGQLLTGGGDGMIPFGIGGAALVAVGAIAGVVVGWRNQSWFSSHLIVSIVGSLVSVALIAGVWIAFGGPPDPILDARDCGEVYELLGATGPQGEILDLPLLSDSDQSNLAEKLDAFGADESDEVCKRLRSDLEAQS